MKDVESVRPQEIHIAAVRPRGDVRDRLIGAESIDALKQGRGRRHLVAAPRGAAAPPPARPQDRSAARQCRNPARQGRSRARSTRPCSPRRASSGSEINVGTAIPTEILLPAPGQAVIGIECRTDDTMTQSVLTTVNNQITYDCVMAERAFTRALGGSCASPVAASACSRTATFGCARRLFSEDGGRDGRGPRGVRLRRRRHAGRAGAPDARPRRPNRSGGCSPPQ